ncbi:alpha-aminoadipic semialdehyde synthase [Tropilaelaps mercedesae]|uniref:Alpha-aminoadipic semialdehyde synthase n=1 Tax=Tropilaelaps mercedesae TaxID=418985 RepID=A0A1V9Y0I6_9ACAR|nr:alpha-aminoadipic semialdehyde synthase [Tropilaelaps mercedesae]
MLSRLWWLRSLNLRAIHSAIGIQCSAKHTFATDERVIAIRREDQSVWERRAPLGPDHVRWLTKAGVKVLIQPSNRRAYPLQSYVHSGAVVQEDISDSPVIIGVKQVPVDQLYPNKTYCFFSHTIKGQEANMPILDACIERNIRLIDYERMCDEKGQRVVAFGKYAGKAGMINILHGLGLRLLALGHHTPFMHIGPAHNYRNSGMGRQAVRDAGYEIALGMMPRSIGPLTFVFTGSGNVSQGAQEVFQELPFEYVDPKDLPEVCKVGSMNKVYGAVVTRQDHWKRLTDGGFDYGECDEFPERYYSTFAKNIAPYASVILNGIYWAVNSPKLITIPDAKRILQPTYTPWLPSSEGSPSLPHRLLAICDISADPGGSIEFMTECTTIDYPFCLYDADQHKSRESFSGPGVLVCSIDNMPTQLPLEATDYFGKLLMPYIWDIVDSDAQETFDGSKMCSVVKNAVITSNGRLTDNYEYISQLRQTSKSMKKVTTSQRPQKKVLCLGAGYVSAPLIEYLCRDGDIQVTVASAIQKEAEELAAKYDNVESAVLDVTESVNGLSNLVRESDLVISLLPYSLHAKVAEHCIDHRTNMVTASYLLPELKELHAAAEKANITVLNEVGLDPGIDHMLAMECFNQVRLNGGKITSFVSFCGGLPAPEHCDNPLRYKFSWSPRSALIGTMGWARYLENGKEIEIAKGGDLLDNVRPIEFLSGFSLEGYPNRDSTVYRDMYDIESAHTVLRGTLRYKGFCNATKGLHMMGLFSDDPHPALHPRGPEITWKQFMCQLMGQQTNLLTSNVRNLIFDHVGRDAARADALERLGLISDSPIDKKTTPMNTLTHYLSRKLSFRAGERDLVILRHDIGIEWLDGQREMRHVNLVAYGDPNGYSAMAKTVGYPCAIAAKMILEGEIQQKGMVLPLASEIYGPILRRLNAEGVTYEEVTTKL